MEVSGQFRAPVSLRPGKKPWYPLDMRLGWSQSLSGRGDEEENSQPLSGIEHPLIKPVAQRYTAELYLPLT
jgi:hypothetical protein